MPLLVPDIPQYVDPSPPFTQAFVQVTPGANWDLAQRNSETAVVRLPDPTPLPSTAAKTSPPDAIKACALYSATVYFAFNSAALSLDTLKADLGSLSPGCAYSVAGYADPVGGRRYNQRLGFHRAHTVTAWLSKAGHTVDSIRSFGKADLATTIPANYAMDRRAVVSGSDLPTVAVSGPAASKDAGCSHATNGVVLRCDGD